MRGLIEKDFRLMMLKKNILLIIAAVCLIFIIKGTTSNYSFVVSYAGICLTIMSLGTINYDKHDNCMSFIMALPITKKDYVLEKYLLGFASAFLGLLFGIICWSVSVILKNSSTSIEENLATLLIYLLIDLLILTVYLPIYIKFDPEQLTLISLITAGIFVGLGYLGFKIVLLLNIDVESFANTVSGGTVAAAAVGLSLLFYVISFMISYKIMLNKEF
ncbi:MAG: ABC-2 transporter permease [Pseudobutyrivibrio sp.]|nr:ABC-2 transporter permease [Pseudobutyrivibrio sp.]